MGADLSNSPLGGIRFDILSEKDEFTFECQRCGKCCKGRDTDKILVSPLDIYNGAKYLGITAEEFIDKYVSFHTGSSSGMIIGTLKADYKGACKLLTYEGSHAKCMVHEKKPLICALHPLGIIHEGENTDEEGNRLYILVEPCKNSGRSGVKIKVSDITDHLPGTAEEIKIAAEIRSMHDITPKRIMFYKGVMCIKTCLAIVSFNDEQIKKFGISERLLRGSRKAIEELEKKIGCTLKKWEHIDDEYFLLYVDMQKTFEDFNYQYSYHDYDTTKPFLEQCKANYEKFKNFIVKMAEGVNLLFDDLAEGMSDDVKKIFEDACIEYGGGIDLGA